MSRDGKRLPSRSSSQQEVDAFLKKVAAVPAARPAGERGRLIFAMDATASREPTGIAPDPAVTREPVL